MTLEKLLRQELLRQERLESQKCKQRISNRREMATLYYLSRPRNLGRKEIVIIAVKVGLRIPRLVVQPKTVNATCVTSMVILQNSAQPRNHQVKPAIHIKVPKQHRGRCKFKGKPKQVEPENYMRNMRPCQALIVNTLSGWKLQPRRPERLFSCDLLPVISRFSALVESKFSAVNAEFLVMESQTSLLVYATATESGILRIANAIAVERNILQRYPSLFSRLGKMKKVAVELKV